MPEERNDIRFRNISVSLALAFLILFLPVGKGSAQTILCSDETGTKSQAALKVNGEITSFSSSPGGHLLALKVMKEDGDIFVTSIVIYNTAINKFVCNVFGDFYEPGIWSRDGYRLAVIEERHSIICIDRNGKTKSFRTKNECGRILWDPENNNSILYCGPWNSKTVSLLSLNDGSERVVARGHDISGLYAMKGKAYYADIVAMPGTCYKVGMQTYEVKSGKKSILIPLYGNIFDTCSISLSPDGRYFFFTCTISSATLNIVALVKDAGLLCKKPYISALYQQAFEDDYKLLWPHLEYEAVVQPQSEPGYFLNLKSGSRRKIVSEAYTFSDGTFFVSPEGLKRINDDGGTSLLIGHKPWKK